MDFEERLLALYAKIPSSRCRANCFACCKDVIQFTPTEEKRMGGYSHNGVCCHLKDGICTVYDRRPFVCRLFGTSENLHCGSCSAEKHLTEAETAALVKEYVQIMKEEQVLVT